MKKCSVSSHQSLSELNITPLLDLAFVLLVIFIITTTPLANDIEMKLPNAYEHKKDPPHDVKYITIQANGDVWLDKDRMANLEDLKDRLLQAREANTNTTVVIRGDSKTKFKNVRETLDACQQVLLLKVDLATEAIDEKKS